MPNACSIVAAPEVEFRARGDNHAALVRSGARRRKWPPTPEIDAAIREGYRRLVELKDGRALTRVARKTGWPKHRITKRGAELGLARVKEAPWSIEEIAVLRANTQYGYELIRKRLASAGFARSRTAILLKRKRMGLVGAGDGYSATALAKLFGIDGHGVTDWITRGWLPAEKRGTDRTERQGGDTWWIRKADVKAFVMGHPDEVDLRKVEKWWFLELITDGGIYR
jgi:hypothetical protein